MELVLDFIIIAGVTITSVLLVTSLKTKNKAPHHKILIAFFILIFLVFVHAYSALHQLTFIFKATFLFQFSILWILGPLFIHYLDALFQNGRLLSRKNLWLYAPIALVIAWIGIPLSIEVYLERRIFTHVNLIDKHQIGFAIIRDIVFLIYLIIGLYTLKLYQKAIKATYSSLSKADITWIRYLFVMCVSFISIDLASLFMEAFNPNAVVYMDYFSIVSLFIVTLFLGYTGVKQPQILIADFSVEHANGSKHPQTFEITAEDKNLIKTLDDLMSRERLFLNEALTLSELAKKLLISDKELSTLLNQKKLISFYDYVNKYRVDEFKKRVKEEQNQHLTLLGIAFDCGFNSKASFNRIFKRHTGLSPSEFKKIYKK